MSIWTRNREKCVARAGDIITLVLSDRVILLQREKKRGCARDSGARAKRPIKTILNHLFNSTVRARAANNQYVSLNEAFLHLL
jgi:hypothetical protein